MEKIDLLNREDFINNVVKLVKQLSDIRKGCCFSIEGSWGIGKTFVLEGIRKRLQVAEDNYYVFDYNCWKYDYYDEPSIAIVSAMIASVQEDKAAINMDIENTVKAGYEFVGEKLCEIAGLYIQNKIGINLVEWTKDIENKKQKNDKATYEFDKMFNFSQTIEAVRDDLQEIAKEKTVVLIVDELDRCIPQYAIKVLERLHHIFYGLENVVLIMSMDRKQLEHSVEEMFGIKNGINIEKYLKKFIDLSIVLDYGKSNQLYKEKYRFYFDMFCANSNEDDLKKILSELLRWTDIRSQEKIFEKARIIHSIICDVEQVDISVLAFEIFYEVLKQWDFSNMSYVSEINDAKYPDLEKRIGEDKIELLKKLELKGLSGMESHGGKKRILHNLNGKVFWYFANIFNQDYMPYEQEMPYKDFAKELEIVKKYCDLCNLII